jgi:JAB1/Mov34/MPN/PAD-1 ubiquitin protease
VLYRRRKRDGGHTFVSSDGITLVPSQKRVRELPQRVFFCHDFGPANISGLLKSVIRSRIVLTLYFSVSDCLFDINFSRAPSVTIHPTALFSILDHYLRRTDAQQRVIGTLLGTRSEGDDTVSVRNAFAVLHSETSEQVAVDRDYHRAMFDLSQRVSPKESIVGWCVRLVAFRHDT